MAVTSAGTALTLRHRRTQQAISAETSRQLLRLWPMLDLARLDETSPAWAAAALSVVRGGHELSARAAMSYWLAFRVAEGASRRWPSFPPATLDEDAARTSLLVTAPVYVKSATGRGLPLGTAGRNALAQSTAAATRHMMSGGRDTITAASDADRQVVGWARAISGDACAFCVVLASRGAAYKSEDTAGFQAHDNCWCWPEPMYDTGEYALPPGVDEARAAYEEATNPHGEWRATAPEDQAARRPREGSTPWQVNEVRRYLAANPLVRS